MEVKQLTWKRLVIGGDGIPKIPRPGAISKRYRLNNAEWLDKIKCYKAIKQSIAVRHAK